MSLTKEERDSIRSALSVRSLRAYGIDDDDDDNENLKPAARRDESRLKSDYTDYRSRPSMKDPNELNDPRNPLCRVRGNLLVHGEEKIDDSKYPTLRCEDRPIVEISTGKFMKYRNSDETIDAYRCGYANETDCQVCRCQFYYVADASVVVCPECMSLFTNPDPYAAARCLNDDGRDIMILSAGLSNRNFASMPSRHNFEHRAVRRKSQDFVLRRGNNVGGVGIGLTLVHISEALKVKIIK